MKLKKNDDIHISYNRLESVKLVFRLLRNFVPEILCLQQAMKDYVSRLDPEYGKMRDFNVGFEGSFGDRHVNPRTLKSQFLGSMVCCEGIVTKCKTFQVEFHLEVMCF